MATGKESGQPARRPMRRRSDYNYAEHGAASGRGLPPGDLTVRRSAEVELVRPDFKHADSLIFRPLPCLEDVEDLSKARFMPYRRSIDKNQFSDFFRAYPAAKGVGVGDDRYTFLLYEKLWVTHGTYERKQNPYVIIYNYAKQLIKTRKFPSNDWLDFTEGQNSILKSPTHLFYFFGLVYKRGSELYVAGKKPPKGAAPDDKTQLIQLTTSAGNKLEKLMNEVRPEWDGKLGETPKDQSHAWERAMVYGDPTHPGHGRFFRVINPDEAGALATDSLDELGDGAWDANTARGAEADAGAQAIRGYDATIDDVLICDGRRTRMAPNIAREAWPAIQSKIGFFDEVLHVPKTEELVVMCVKALRSCRALLERAWADHPEWLELEGVEAILDASPQLYTEGRRGARGAEVADDHADASNTRTSAVAGGASEWGAGLEFEDAGAVVPDAAVEAEEGGDADDDDGGSAAADYDDAAYEDATTAEVATEVDANDYAGYVEDEDEDEVEVEVEDDDEAADAVAEDADGAEDWEAGYAESDDEVGTDEEADTEPSVSDYDEYDEPAAALDDPEAGGDITEDEAAMSDAFAAAEANSSARDATVTPTQKPSAKKAPGSKKKKVSAKTATQPAAGAKKKKSSGKKKAAGKKKSR